MPNILMRDGDLANFYEILCANFAGNTTECIEAAMGVYTIALTTHINIRRNGRFSGIESYCTPKKIPPSRLAHAIKFDPTQRIADACKTLRDHRSFKDQGDATLIYSALCAYQRLIDPFLDSADYINDDGADAEFSFGGVLDLAPPLDAATLEQFVDDTRTWFAKGQNNLRGLAPIQISMLAKEIYKDAHASATPRKILLKMYRYQEKFKSWRGFLRIVRD